MTDNRLDPVARKPIDTNPQLQVTKVFISLIKNDFKSSFQAYGKEKSKAKLRHKNLLDESSRISKYTRIKVHVNPGSA